MMPIENKNCTDYNHIKSNKDCWICQTANMMTRKRLRTQEVKVDVMAFDIMYRMFGIDQSINTDVAPWHLPEGGGARMHKQDLFPAGGYAAIACQELEAG